MAAEGVATFTVDASLGNHPGEGVHVVLQCDESGKIANSVWIQDGGTQTLQLSVPEGAERTCSIRAEASGGELVHYRGDGGSATEIADDGCHFSGVRAGHANYCQVVLEVPETSVTVYKKWIGTSRPEEDAEARLRCAGRLLVDSRDVNVNRPGRWKLEFTDPAGINCSVEEQQRDDFVGDVSDCRDLLILPGTEEECTLVNTKVVKMIEMLNRYGLFIMIGVFLVAGMIASRRVVG